jgi:hypothetical protein
MRPRSYRDSNLDIGSVTAKAISAAANSSISDFLFRLRLKYSNATRYR